MTGCLSGCVVKPFILFNPTLPARFASPIIIDITASRARIRVARTNCNTDDKLVPLDWESELVADLDPVGFKPPSSLKKKKRTKKQPGSRLLKNDSDDEDENMGWCVRARQVALKSINSRGFSRTMEDLVTVKTAKKRDNNKTKKKNKKSKKAEETAAEDSEDDSAVTEEEEESGGATEELKKKIGMFNGGMFEAKKEKTMEELVERLSQLSATGGPSNRGGEIRLNKEIVGAQTAHQVLEVISEAMEAVSKGLSPSPLSPLNVATALHRVAKNMESVSMAETHRLGLARHRDASMLVGLAMQLLPDCSPQGLSNIAWALSKIGGDLLYLSEMDRVAEVAADKAADFNSQNVANVAGAFASMKHSSPELFSRLSHR